MPSEIVVLNDDQIDDDADVKIAECLNLENPKSFFLFAGAGSGKTRSLVKALATATTTIGKKLRLSGQQIGVITYTNNACEEIKRRLNNDSLVYVSTIHSFIWYLIRGFNSDIKEWLKSTLNDDIEELCRKRSGSKAEANRLYSIASKQKRLQELDSIKKFTYSPTTNNTEQESLTHSEVLQLGAYFLTEKPLMQKILTKKFPILLIDECQDTNKGLVDVFLTVQKCHRNEFTLGLFGDTMQRIYGDGKPDLEKELPTDWEKPAKIMNHRSPTRIIELINKIRSDEDSQKQQARQDKQVGTIRLFVIQSEQDKQDAEALVMKRMADITGDSEWNERKSIKSLVLEHRMAAYRMGFGEMFDAVHPSEELRLGLLNNTSPEIRLFSEVVLPIQEAHKKGDKFAIANVVKKHSRLFKRQYMNDHKAEAKNILETAKNNVEELCKAGDDNPEVTFGELLKIIYSGGVFGIPNGYKPILMRTPAEETQADVFDDEDNNAAEPSTDKVDCLDNFLKTRFSQIKKYADYFGEQPPFHTHQGVKGLEFPRVMVIIDDSDARGHWFSYEKLFGTKNKTATDIKNENEGKETGIDRTRRLFYVICSRAEESLAVVAYTDDPAGLKASLSGKGWFSDEEIIVL